MTYNAMRQDYRTLTDLEKEVIEHVKEVGEHLYNFLTAVGDSREISLAKTKVEEAVMWAVKHITR